MDVRQLAFNIRKDVLDMTLQAGANGGHIGGALSCADILAVLYGKIFRNGTDKFILSKGHVALAHYAVLAECGYFDKEKLMTFEKSGSTLTTHEVKGSEDGIEISGGSLGYGVSIASGIALRKKQKKENSRIFVLMGDGECDEGSVWEGAISASKLKLDNLTVILDVNGLQLDGDTASIMPIRDLGEIFASLGWNVIRIDGHNLNEIEQAFGVSNIAAPTVIVAKTVKGKGISSIEGKRIAHHMRITQEEYNTYVSELEKAYA
ncbi:MAG: transketolase [Bacteroidales bacterium]|nr:transketolase [Bacteroidales bacterium]